MGCHAQVTVVDLAVFLDEENLDDVSWNDFLVLGAEGGFTLFTSLGLGVDLRYFVDERPIVFGAKVSYFVPFIDLN